MLDEYNTKQNVITLNNLLKTHDIQNIIDIGSELLGNPLLYTDINHNLISMTTIFKINDKNWTTIKDLGSIPLSNSILDNINKIYLKSIELHSPVLDTTIDGSLSLLRKVISYKGKIIGYLNSMSYFKTFSDDEIELFDLISNLIPVAMQVNDNYTDSPNNLLEFFIADLLSGKLSDKDLIEKRLQFFNFNPNGNFQVVIIRSAKDNETNTHFESIVLELQNRFPLNKVLIYGNEIKIIRFVPENIENNDIFFSYLNKILISNNLISGLSRIFDDIYNIANLNNQAVKAIDLGILLHPKQLMHFYDEYAIYDCLQLCSQHWDLLRFCHSSIFTIGAYDRIHNTSLLETLKIYLMHHKSITEASNAMFIHRNTMIYRIHKIDEIINVDLEDTNIFFHILFSFRILEYYSVTVMNNHDQNNNELCK